MNKKLSILSISRLMLFLAFITVAGHLNAQNINVSATMDSTHIFIGGQIDLKLQLSQPANMDIDFPLLTDTITKNIEIVRMTEPDTINQENDRWLIERSYRITSFDSGLHFIPPIVFEQAQAKLGLTLQTEPMALQVVNPFGEVDPQKGILDIKQPIETPFLLAELKKYLPWVLGFILLSGLITLAAMKYFGRELPVKIFKKEVKIIPPHERALSELDRIKQEKLWQQNRIKEYYSGVTDALRHYIEGRFEIRAMEQTSDEIMDSFKGVEDTDVKSLDNLKQILQTADLVKFAKHEPLPDENDLSMINAYFFVNQTKIEELKSLEEEKEEMLKKEEEAETTKN